MAKAKKVTIPPYKGELSSTTKPNYSSIIMLTNAWSLVAYRSDKRLASFLE